MESPGGRLHRAVEGGPQRDPLLLTSQTVQIYMADTNYHRITTQLPATSGEV